MKRYESVNAYVEGFPQYRNELITLRDLMVSTEMEETVKWGAPCYTVNGKNVVGLGAFKSYVGIWFYQGVFLSDPKKVLINAQEGTTKALRQWRFNSALDIDKNLIKAYVEEAIQNQKEGKELKPEKKKALEIPKELASAFKENNTLLNQFNTFSTSKQRDFIEHILSAKREETKIKRIDKIIPMILNNQGLYDKYKNC